jgi:hypothetical protein
MAFSALGLLISLLGLLLVCRFSGQVASSAGAAVDVAVAALTSTKQNLDLASRGLEQAQVALGATQGLMESADSGLENTSVMLGSVGDIMADDLPGVIEESQRSLSAAQEGAAVIENVLYGLNTISALTRVTYDPDVSLTESFAAMNDSLATLPETFANLDESLKAAQENLDDLQTASLEVSGPLAESEAVLAEAQTSLEDYSKPIDHLTLSVSDLQKNLPNLMRIIIFSLYFLLIWLAVSQIGFLWQGWEMVTHDPSLLEHRLHDLEKKVEGLVSQG